MHWSVKVGSLRAEHSPRVVVWTLQIFDVVILLEVLFENELILYNFIVLFLFVFQQLSQSIFIGPIKYNIV